MFLLFIHASKYNLSQTTNIKSEPEVSDLLEKFREFRELPANQNIAYNCSLVKSSSLNKEFKTNFEKHIN